MSKRRPIEGCGKGRGLELTWPTRLVVFWDARTLSLSLVNNRLKYFIRTQVLF